MKKKTLVPLIVFLLGICLASLVVYKTDTHEKEQSRTTAQLNATTYGERIENEIINGIEITDVLKQLLISGTGEINQFDTIAKNIMSDSVESVQLAPAGIVTDIYPADGNEAGKIDLIHDKERGEISIYARDHHTIVTQGPFELKQGGYGIAVRNPIYLKDENGQEYFWGFTIVILRVPDIFSDATSALSKFGYEYSLSKTDNPWSDNYKVVYQSDRQLTNPVSYDFTIGEENWKFEVTPENGWENNTLIAVISVFFIAITLLLAVLTRVWLVSKENKNKFQILAHTDSLTGIYNRYGFDELAEQMNKTNKEILSILKDKGIEVASHMSTLSDEQIDAVKSEKTSEDTPKKKNIVQVFRPQNSQGGGRGRNGQGRPQGSRNGQRQQGNGNGQGRSQGNGNRQERTQNGNSQGRPQGNGQGRPQNGNRQERPQGNGNGQGRPQNGNRQDRPQGENRDNRQRRNPNGPRNGQDQRQGRPGDGRRDGGFQNRGDRRDNRDNRDNRDGREMRDGGRRDDRRKSSPSIPAPAIAEQKPSRNKPKDAHKKKEYNRNEENEDRLQKGKKGKNNNAQPKMVKPQPKRLWRSRSSRSQFRKYLQSRNLQMQ